MTDGNAGRSEAPTDEELDLESKKIKVASDWTDLALRQVVGFGALALMLLQILVADVVFIVYAMNNAWELPVAAITGWLGATVIQVVGVVLVITNYLFPRS